MSPVRFWYIALCLAVFAPAAAAEKPKGPDPASSLKLGKTDRILTRHNGGVCGVSYSPDGKVIATAGGDAVVRLLDVATGKELRQFTGHKGFLRTAQFSPDGKRIASGGDDREIILWDPATGKELRRLAGHANGLRRAIFTPDGKKLVTGGFDEHVRVWDVATGKELIAWRAHRRVVYGLSLTPDGKTLATGGDNEGVVRIWHLGAGVELRRWDAHPKYVYSVAYSPDGRWLATGGDDSAARVWEVATGKEVRRLDGHDSGVHKVVFSPDGRLLASAGYHKSVHLWDLLSGKEVYRFGEHGDTGWVWGLAYAPDGRSVLSGGKDTTAVLWDLAGRGRPAKPAQGALTAQQREALWAALGSDDAAKAFEASWALSADAKNAVAFLQKHLKPVKLPKVDDQAVARLIGELDSDSFATREKASRALDRLGPGALPAMRQALVKPPSLEVRRRLEVLVRRHGEGALSPEELRALRALHVLETTATPAARLLLESLALGDPEAALTRQAKAAIRRLARR
jgi:tricorn protease-like protein